jgi:hypothetical protein
MTVHLIKLCVGVDTVAELEDWVKERARASRKRSGKVRLEHVTRTMPKRRDEVLEGGSLYWVIKGFVQVRQPIIGLEPRRGKDGIERCAICFAPKLVTVMPHPHRAFQGWRYLEPKDAPGDLGASSVKSREDLPPELLLELRSLGIL